MLHRLYSVLITLLLPLAMLKFLRRSIKNPAYRHNLLERVSLKLKKVGSQPLIHIHLVSVGEANGASFLIQQLIKANPTQHFLISVTTPTGRQRVTDLFSKHSNTTICYLPLDLNLFMRRFWHHYQPKVSIILETEIWPNFLHQAKKLHIPCVLVNARMSDKSCKGYLRFPQTINQLINHFDLILAQYQADQQRFIKMGVSKDKIHAIGNLKFDIQLPQVQITQAQKHKEICKRPIWIAASTHEGEDEQLLTAHQKLLETLPTALLIIVPRHPERFNSVYELSRKQFSCQRRTEVDFPDLSTEVFIGDTLGEMFYYLALSDTAFVGGSLIPNGGHNPIEPAALGLPIISGSHIFNFSVVFNQCIDKEFCFLKDEPDEIAETLLMLFKDKTLREAISERAKSFVSINQGTTARTIEQLSTFI